MAVFISEHNEAQKYGSSLFDFNNVLAENCIKSNELSTPKSNVHNILPRNSISSNIYIKMELPNDPNFHSLNSSGERHSTKSNIYEKFKSSWSVKESESQNIMPVLNHAPKGQVTFNGSQICEGILEKCNDVDINPTTSAIDILSQKKKNGFDEVFSNSPLDWQSNYSFTGHSYEAGVISFSDNMLWPSNLHMEEGGGEESASDFGLENNFSVDDKEFELMKYQGDETLHNFDIILDNTESKSKHSEITVQIDNSTQVNNNLVLFEKTYESSHLTQTVPYLGNYEDDQNLVKEWNGNVQSSRFNSRERRERQTISDSDSVDEIGVDIDSFECCGYSIDFKPENVCNINASCNEYNTLEGNNSDENKAMLTNIHDSKPICNNKDQNKEEHINTRIKLIVNALKYGSIRDGIKLSKVKHLSSSESSNCKKSNSGNKRNHLCSERNDKYGDHSLPNERHFNTISSENRQNYSVT